MDKPENGSKTALIAGKSDSEIALMLIEEWRNAAPINVVMPAETAYHLVGLLQLACRHRLVGVRSRELVEDFIRQLGEVGPVTAETFAWGWMREHDG